jgi:hypothetical protein
LWIRNGSLMMAPTVLRELSDEYGSWNIICISRRRGCIFLRLNPVYSSPSKNSWPSVGS